MLPLEASPLGTTMLSCAAVADSAVIFGEVSQSEGNQRRVRLNLYLYSIVSSDRFGTIWFIGKSVPIH